MQSEDSSSSTNPTFDSSGLKEQMQLIGMVCDRLASGERFTSQARFVTSKICRVLDVDACVIRRVDSDGLLELIYAYGVPDGLLLQKIPSDVGIARELVYGRKTMTVLNTETDHVTRKLQANAQAKPGHLSFRSYAGVPMLVHEQVVGVIGVYMFDLERQFTPEEMNLLQILGNAVGLAVRNDHLHRRISGLSTTVRLRVMELLENADHVSSIEDTPLPIKKSPTHQLEYDLRQGDLDFVVYYQPLCRPGEVTPKGMEALIRWNHPRLGMLLPNEFIPIAEAKGLMNQIGQKVYSEVAEQFGAMQKETHQDCFVALNTSIYELDHPDFPERVQKTFASRGIAPHQVVLEITERSPLVPRSQAIRNLYLLHELGYRVFLDDFGTGHTSLSYLLEYQFSGVKIDKEFMPANRGDTRRIALVRSLVQMAKDQGMLAVAEGVEFEEQAEICENLGFDLIQGFAVGRPEPLAR